MSLEAMLAASLHEDPTKLPHYEGIARAIREIVDNADLVTICQIFVKRGRDAVNLIDRQVPSHEQTMKHVEAKNYWMGQTVRASRAQKAFLARKAAGKSVEATPELRERVKTAVMPRPAAEGEAQFKLYESLVTELEALAK